MSAVSERRELFHPTVRKDEREFHLRKKFESTSVHFYFDSAIETEGERERVGGGWGGGGVLRVRMKS